MFSKQQTLKQLNLFFCCFVKYNCNHWNISLIFAWKIVLKLRYRLAAPWNVLGLLLTEICIAVMLPQNSSQIYLIQAHCNWTWAYIQYTVYGPLCDASLILYETAICIPQQQLVVYILPNTMHHIHK